MKMKALWMCVIGAMLASSAMGQIITSVIRANGQSDTRDPIGTYNGSTAPLPTQNGGLKDGNYIYSDRTYTWINSPTGTLGPLNTPLIGSEYVRTFNTDKATGETDVTYTVTFSMACTIWITIDDRAWGTRTPQQAADEITKAFAAPGSFTDTGLDVFVNGDSNRQLSVFAGTFGPGTYVFGPNNSGNDFYVIGAVPGDPKFNPAPLVDAGPLQAFAKPTFPLVVQMNATVTDEDPQDPTEPRGVISYAWSIVSGPAGATISNAAIEDPTVTVNLPGEYVMKLVGSDGSKQAEDTMTIYVNDVSKNMLMAHWNFESLTTTNKSVVDVAKGNNGVWTAAEPNQVPTIVPGWITGSTQAVDFRAPAANPPIVKVPGPGRVDVTIADTEPNFVNTPRYAITVSAWIKVSAFSTTWSTAVSKGDDSWRLARQSRDGTNQNAMAIHFNGLTPGAGMPGNGPNGTISVNDNFWHHVCGTFDGEKIRLYIDGVLDVEGPYTGLINTSTYPIQISGNAQQTNPIRPWDGILDEIRVYNYALDEAGIRALTAQGRTVPFVDAGTITSPLTYKTGDAVPLNGRVLDYGVPGTVTTLWTTVSGPDGAEATFANPSSP
ncbi:MAG: LamG domain-containing protein, partial [Phycisphaerae bacterium]|nr:LamG domain-containing protein [Phycisphaerae bacterium]